MEYADLLGRLVKVAPRLGEREDSYGPLVLDSLVSLVSSARKREGRGCARWSPSRCRGGASGDAPHGGVGTLRESRLELFFSDDLKADRLSRTLPVIHCRDCGPWAGLLRRPGRFGGDTGPQVLLQRLFQQKP
jgi:hypothetical protein